MKTQNDSDWLAQAKGNIDYMAESTVRDLRAFAKEDDLDPDFVLEEFASRFHKYKNKKAGEK